MPLQQGFATSGMGPNQHFAQQQYSKADVRIGSLADIPQCTRHVRFTPNSGHSRELGLMRLRQYEFLSA